jgi:molybdopterin-binding protein
VIRLDGLRVRVGSFDLQGISLEVPTGGYALIIGPTGSGKTTLLDAVAGHAPLLEGRVWAHGEDVTDLPPEQRRLGIVYQQYHLFPHLSVGENIAYGLRRAADGAEEAATQRVKALASLLGIDSLLDRGVRGLSGGEQQRVAIARALAPRPRVLLLDEPFAAVDPATRTVLRRELRALHEAEGITTLQVTHDFDDALRLGDMVAVMADGHIVQQGRPEDVFRFPNSAFVARFVGTGNVIAGQVHRTGETEDDGRFTARFVSGSLELHVVADREGTAHAVIRPEDILLSAEPLPASIRNRLEAEVVRVEHLGPVVQVQLAAGRDLVAAVTSATANELGLRPGIHVWLGLKATAVHLV